MLEAVFFIPLPSMHISIAAETLFYIGSFPVTNAFLVTIIVSVFLITFFLYQSSHLKLIPSGSQNVMEVAVEAWWNLTKDIAQDKKLAYVFFPLVVTIFFFVLFSNWLGLVPGVGSVGIMEVHGEETAFVPILRSASADLNATLAIALISVFFVQFIGIASIGAFRYGKKFFVSPFKKPFYILGTFIGLLELISELVRLISFSFRLFGNIFAGEVLLIVMLTLVPYFIPLPFFVLEIFVGLVQAFVFAILTLVFLKMATIEATGH